MSRELNWTHFRTIMYLKDELRHEFYVEMARIENWNTRTLNKKIDSIWKFRNKSSGIFYLIAIKRNIAKEIA